MQLLDNEHTRLSGRRSEQRIVRKNKVAAKESMRPDMADLKSWLAGDYDAFSCLDEPTLRLKAEAQSWTVGESKLKAATVDPCHCFFYNMLSHNTLPPCRSAVPWCLPLGAAAADGGNRQRRHHRRPRHPPAAAHRRRVAGGGGDGAAARGA